MFSMFKQALNTKRDWREFVSKNIDGAEHLGSVTRDWRRWVIDRHKTLEAIGSIADYTYYKQSFENF